MKVTHKQICIVLLHLSSESDSVFLLAPVCLVVSLMVFTASVLVLHPDSLMMSGACLNVQVLSSLINSNSKHTVQQLKAFHV